MKESSPVRGWGLGGRIVGLEVTGTFIGRPKC